MRSAVKRASLLLVFALTLAVACQAQQRKGLQWVGAWAASQQVPEPQNALAIDDLRDVTIRQMFRVSLGGQQVRIHLSNVFGTEPLHFTSVHVARPLSPSTAAIDPVSDRAVTFSGSPAVTVPAGSEFISDPVDLPVAALSNLAVSFHLNAAPAQQTGHPGSRATSYHVHGDLVSAPNLPDAKQVNHWYNVSAIDVLASRDAAAIVVLGDSITDGYGCTTNGNDRWTDVLAARLQASPRTRNIGILNAGIGGNHVLTDGLGPNALARFDRDVLVPAGVRWVIVFEGINDLGKLSRNGPASPADHAQLVHNMIGAYKQFVLRAHAHGIKVIGATITPFVRSEYYHPDRISEADRQAINQWIRNSGEFDAVIDLDKVLRDPNQPDQLLPRFDSGDHLHPSLAGYRAIGEAIPLSVLTR